MTSEVPLAPGPSFTINVVAFSLAIPPLPLSSPPPLSLPLPLSSPPPLSLPLCLDPNVEVLYISPVPVEDEIQEYYGSLLAMGQGGEGAMERVHFVTPERAGAFSRHRMALSSVLLYSPMTVERIRHLTAGRDAYIMPGVVSRDDLAVADELGGWLLQSLHLSSDFGVSNDCCKEMKYDTTVSFDHLSVSLSVCSLLLQGYLFLVQSQR